MRDIVVAFKGVPEHQLSDPGPELSRVLAFRRRIETSHEVLHRTFDAPDEFERIIRRHLQRWAREHERGVLPKQPRRLPEPPSAEFTAPRPDPQKGTSDVVDDAKSLRREGRVVDAEALLAGAVVDRGDIEALDEYARLLRNTGRVTRSTRTSEQQLELAQGRDDADAVIDAYINLGLSKRKLGDLAGSVGAWRDAVDFAKDLSPSHDRELGFLYDNLGLTLRRAGKLAESRIYHDRAIALREQIGDVEGLAHSNNNLGILALEIGDSVLAESSHRTALDLFERIDDVQGAASALGNLGMALQANSRFKEAERTYRESRALNLKIENRRGLAINAAQLARLALRVDDVEQAEEHARKCLELNEQIDDRVGVATAMELLGQVFMMQGQIDRSVELLEQSVRGFDEMGHEAGKVRAMATLAQAMFELGLRDSAKRTAQAAEARADDLGMHRTLEQLVAILAKIETSRGESKGRPDTG